MAVKKLFDAESHAPPYGIDQSGETSTVVSPSLTVVRHGSTLAADQARHASIAQIRDWAVAGESEVQEFKRSTGERREAAITLCALLNQRGGRVFFGIDFQGTVVGQQVSDRTIEEVAQEFREIDPPAFPSIDRVAIGGGREVLIVGVQPGQNRPYSYRGRAYRRVGNTNQRLSRDEYNRMLLEQIHSEQRWENQVAANRSVADLDVSEVSKTVDEAIRRGRMDDPGSRDTQSVLRGLGLLKGQALLRAAYVLFGETDRLASDHPQCLLRLARFAGTDKTEFRDNRQYHGNVFVLLSAAERFLLTHTPIAGRVVPGELARVDRPLYPVLAVREALANAFCHRDYTIGGGSVAVAIYDDRLEVTSSGTLHFGLTPEALFAPHDSLPWNPLVASVFFRRGIIESWGRGTLKMAELAASAGLPRPEIEDGRGCVTVRFRSRHAPLKRAGHDPNERHRAILAALNEVSGGLSLAELVSRVDFKSTKRQVREDLRVLRTHGLATSTGHGRGARWILL